MPHKALSRIGLAAWQAAICALFLFPLGARASSLTEVNCHAVETGRARCEIRLTGTVEPGERLFLPSAQDTDRLFSHETLLGSTGYLLQYPVAVPFFPRVYSLQPLQGQTDPTLTLDTLAFFQPSWQFPRAKVIPATFPLRKAYLPFFLRTVGFLILLSLSLFVISCVRRATIDGWTYPADELRWFFGSLCSFLCLSSPYSRFLVPGLWSAASHEFVSHSCLAVSLWCLAYLLLNARFNDRSCVERGLYHRPSARYRAFSTLGLLASLAVILPPFHFGEFGLLGAQALPLIACLFASIRSFEWKRVLKRSGPSPLLFHFSLLAFALAAGLAPALTAAFGTGGGPLWYAAVGALLFGALRMHRYFKTQRKSRELVKECREFLRPHARASDRLHALCDFIEDEWAAARVSVISVEGGLGLAIASAGPDAIPNVDRSRARKLGPFLRRVCREGHILYAPVAEELGHDLQKEGLKHSSLAIPLCQQGKVRAVLCMMADEGERIPPIEAASLELFTAELFLEILSTVAQHVAEKKCEQLLAIAREADGVAVEHLDDWGRLHYSEKEEMRFLVGAKMEAVTAHPGCLALRKAQTEFVRELRAVWHSLALAFEFVPREIKEDFWVLSPKEFRHPYLRALGPEQVSLLLASALDRHARLVAAKEGYLLLAQPATRIVAGEARLRLVAYGAQENGAFEVDSVDFERLRRLRDRAGPAGPVFLGTPNAYPHLQVRAIASGTDENREYCSILAAFADKKELRKIETKALETARESLRKAA